MEQNQGFDWIEAIIHFVFGAFLGLFLSGVVVFWFADIFQSIGGFVIGGSSLFFALLAGSFRDRFWKSLSNNFVFHIWSALFK